MAKDMIAVRIGPELRIAVVGAPSYFADHPSQKTPHELPRHRCINIRLPTAGGLYACEFEKNARELNVRADGSFMFNDMSLVLRAATEVLGLATVIEGQATGLVAGGRLERVLADWCPPFPGYHLDYPNRRHPSPGLRRAARGAPPAVVASRQVVGPAAGP